MIYTQGCTTFLLIGFKFQCLRNALSFLQFFVVYTIVISTLSKAVRKCVYMTYQFANTGPTLVAIISGEMAAEGKSSVSSAGAKF